MNNDLEKLWKEASWSNVRPYPRICMESLTCLTQDMWRPGQDSNWAPSK